MSSLRISETIVRLRKQKGITQDELATFLGVTKASVSKWENGQSMPDMNIRCRCIKHYAGKRKKRYNGCINMRISFVT